MTVNNGGNLSKEYFNAYIRLIMNARNCSLEDAEVYIYEHFFNGNSHSFGEFSYSSYLKAVEEMSME
ncbi:hypothetical protein [Lysinibacillus sp. SGAir0095]|uniref:hypothetical protein n=1 Tax=Lysinibacillus sp. SGAir0095 TaxID=2070463 RepID=UPI0010CCF24A|nr:hypothetical protein [Lysinibacillus sp. SGAir0095]QCR32307.1 hypothetical protein C1N55_09025 [Lysinibacillus sp. SGAir0095]